MAPHTDTPAESAATEASPDDAAAPGKTVSQGIEWLVSAPFVGIQIGAVVAVIVMGWSWSGLALALGLYAFRMFAVTATYHRYLSHRSFRTSRPFQFILSFLACTAAQKGPLWWAAHHRAHHKYSDTERDVHSAKQRGFLWAHVGWILDRRYRDTDWARIKDLSVFPELRWLNNWHLLPPALLVAGLYLAAGTWGVVWGFLVSTTLLWHGTFTVNSLSHLVGKRRYQTTDDSRNSFIIAIWTLGEGWHNNHHYYQRSERQGFFWWELDITHYCLKALSLVGLVWDLHEPPAHVRDELPDAEKKAA